MKTKRLALDLMKHVKSAPKLELGPINNVLKPEEMPAMSPSVVGRMRLVKALRNRYGSDYKNRPGVQQAIDHFDSQMRYTHAYLAQKKLNGGSSG